MKILSSFSRISGPPAGIQSVTKKPNSKFMVPAACVKRALKMLPKVLME
jgi:hypothetical protein